jgi:hypothetical protein
MTVHIDVVVRGERRSAGVCKLSSTGVARFVVDPGAEFQDVEISTDQPEHSPAIGIATLAGN